MHILDLITEIRESFYGAEYVYKNGSCFKFAELLRKMYGGSVVDLRGHCVLRLGNKLYDIGGEVVTDVDINTLGLEPESGGFYTNKYARYDIVLDSDGILDLKITAAQIKTIIVREAQALRFGHDLKLVRHMVETTIKSMAKKLDFDFVIFDRKLSQEEHDKYSTTHSIIVLNQEQNYLTFCIEGTV